MEGPPLGPGGEDITSPDQVAPRGRKASSTRKIKPQTSNLLHFFHTPNRRFHQFHCKIPFPFATSKAMSTHSFELDTCCRNLGFIVLKKAFAHQIDF